MKINLCFKNNTQEKLSQFKKKKVIVFYDEKEFCYKEFLTKEKIPIINYQVIGTLKKEIYFSKNKENNSLLILKDTKKEKVSEEKLKEYCKKRKKKRTKKTTTSYISLNSSCTEKELMNILINHIQDSIIYFDYFRQKEILSALKLIIVDHQSIEEKINRLLKIENVIDTEVEVLDMDNRNLIKKKIDCLDKGLNEDYSFINQLSLSNIDTSLVIIKYMTSHLFKKYQNLEKEDLDSALSSLNDIYLFFFTLLVEEKINFMLSSNISSEEKIDLLREKYSKDNFDKITYLGNCMDVMKKITLEKNTELVLK